MQLYTSSLLFTDVFKSIKYKCRYLKGARSRNWGEIFLALGAGRVYRDHRFEMKDPGERAPTKFHAIAALEPKAIAGFIPSCLGAFISGFKKTRLHGRDAIASTFNFPAISLINKPRGKEKKLTIFLRV